MAASLLAKEPVNPVSLRSAAAPYAPEGPAPVRSTASTDTATPARELAAPVVMQVVINLTPGGAECLVVEIAKRLSPRFRTVVCCLDLTGPLERELVALGVRVVALGRRPGFQPALGYRIAALASRYQASVLHCHQYSPFVYGSLAVMLKPGLRLVFTEHGRNSDEPASWKRRLVNPLLSRLPVTIFAVSGALRGSMIAEGFPAARVQVIHNGIDPGEAPTDGGRILARRALGIPEDRIVIGTVARLDPVKDLPTLVDAFAALRSRLPRAALAIMGDGPERTRLEKQVRSAGLEHCVYFTGFRSDVRSLLPALDLYVNCSIHEGISVAILEAMAAAIPVIATRVGGNSEVVVNGQTGVLVPTRSPVQLSAAIEALAGAADRCRQMGLRGRLAVERHFNINRMMNDYIRAYQGLAPSPHPLAPVGGGW